MTTLDSSRNLPPLELRTRSHRGSVTETRKRVAEYAAGLTKFDVMQLSLDAMQSVVMRYRVAGFPPDLLVSIPKDACGSLDFHRAEAMIELGRTLTAEALEQRGDQRQCIVSATVEAVYAGGAAESNAARGVRP